MHPAYNVNCSSLYIHHVREITMSQQVQVEYDNKGQMERIQSMVVPPEILYAVFDEKGRGTGFVGITDRRLIFMDQGTIRKNRLIVSLPFSKLTLVAMEDTGRGIFTSSKLLVVAGSREFDFDFHGNDKAHRAYQLIMWNLLQDEKKGMMGPR